MHEGMTPSQKRVEAYATKGLSWGSGRRARVPTHIGRVGRVRHLVPYPLYAFLTHASPPSLIHVLPSLALAWVDKPVRKGMGTSVKRAGCRGVLGLAWTPSLSSYVRKSQNQGLYNRVS